MKKQHITRAWPGRFLVGLYEWDECIGPFLNLDGLTYIERNKVNFLFFSLVQLAVSPRAKSLDVGQIFPRNLRAEILSKIGQMTGLEKLDLSSRVGNGGAGGVWGGGSAMTGVAGGSSPTAWASTWKSLRTLTRLRHFTLRQDCQVVAVPFFISFKLRQIF